MDPGTGFIGRWRTIQRDEKSKNSLCGTKIDGVPESGTTRGSPFEYRRECGGMEWIFLRLAERIELCPQ